MESYRVA
jgi:hypothetical protein